MNLDILKVIVVSIAFLFFNIKIRHILRKSNFWIINTGLILILFASILDFTDGLTCLDNFPILGSNAKFHDILEDQIGDTLGIALYTFGVFRQIFRKVAA